MAKLEEETSSQQMDTTVEVDTGLVQKKKSKKDKKVKNVESESTPATTTEESTGKISKGQKRKRNKKAAKEQQLEQDGTVGGFTVLGDTHAAQSQNVKKSLHTYQLKFMKL